MTLLDISIQSRVFIGISAMVLLFAGFLVAFISNQRKKIIYHKNLQQLHEEQQQMLLEQNAKLEERVADRTRELRAQTEALEIAITDLKASQLQLVQKEKMASLGEMATGIAHEIQNPLNFVNNFSELNMDILGDLKANIQSGDPEEIRQLATDAMQNMEKIVHHGKRADNIVKSLLQHVRSKSDEITLYDINTLVEGNLNLCYRNICTRDKNFSAVVDTRLDRSIDQVRIVPQDISRVLTNVMENAFYSLQHKKAANPSFAPVLSVETSRAGNRIRIVVKDNGLGIPQAIINKIYQPFFTTKPTGEGTGLGLSLSYEIIKAHGGEIRVSSEEGEYAEFVIELPV